MTDSFDEVDCGDDASLLDGRILLSKGEHGGAIAATPRPDGVSLVKSLSRSLLVERMLGKQLL